MSETTPNYSFFMPDEKASMSDVKKNITDNFKKIEFRNDITILPAGSAMPQVGDYEIGDRVFRNDAADLSVAKTWPSNYMLICKDANWGWHWRPIQQMMSPWVAVPSTAILEPGWEIHPTSPLSIALDSRGFCHWRGAIRKTVAGIPSGTSISVFKNVPLGIRPNTIAMYTIALSPTTGIALGKAGNVGGRIFISSNGDSSVRVFNADNGVSQDVWFDGLAYNNSYEFYYNG